MLYKVSVDGRPLVCDDIAANSLSTRLLGTHDKGCSKQVRVTEKWVRSRFEVVSDDI